MPDSGSLPPVEPPDASPGSPHLGPVFDGDIVDRARFEPGELAIVLSHYDLGVIRAIDEYARGSRRAPKLRLRTDQGEFLLKRRAPGRDEPDRVAFAQELQLRLIAAGYPVPAIIRTRQSNATLVTLNRRIYELFAFIRGRRADRSQEAAHQAGHALGRLHRHLKSHIPGHTPAAGSYHGSRVASEALAQIPARIADAEPGLAASDIEPSCGYLLDSYSAAHKEAESLGVGQWDRCILHGDWHPGNLLYQDGKVAAVLDFDSARVETRLIDVANGSLQFSMRPDDVNDPDTWPDQLDAKRIRALVGGYDQGAGEPLTQPEREALPWLIVEALIVESVIPIAQAGRFAHLKGSSFLRMVERKVRWLMPRAKRLTDFLEV